MLAARRLWTFFGTASNVSSDNLAIYAAEECELVGVLHKLLT
jgi:hypothetical protein